MESSKSRCLGKCFIIVCKKCVSVCCVIPHTAKHFNHYPNWLPASRSALYLHPVFGLCYAQSTAPLTQPPHRLPGYVKKLLTQCPLPLSATLIPLALSIANSVYPETLDTNAFCLRFACVLLPKQTNKHILFHSLSYSNITKTVSVTRNLC